MAVLPSDRSEPAQWGLASELLRTYLIEDADRKDHAVLNETAPLSLPWLDAVLPIIYLVAVGWLGWRVGRGTHNADQLFLAGRSLGFGVIGLSLFASNISSTTLIGLAGAAYSSGIAVSSYEWMAALVLLFAALVLVPLYLRNRVRTIPDYLAQRFDPRLKRYTGVLMIFLSIIVDTAGSLYAGALVLQVLVPGLPLWPTIMLLGIFAGLYTAAGGLRAVMLTDVIQALVLLIGSGVLVIACFARFDYSWSAVHAALPPGHLSMIRPVNDPELPWPGLLFGLPVLGLYYWTTNQYISQRFLAARNEDHARWGALLAAFLKLSPLFLMVLPGAMAVHLYPGLESADQVFPLLVRELLPVGLRGLVIAGLLAAIMSTIDSTLNAASAVALYDLADLEKRQFSARTQLRIGRLTTLFFMVIAIAWAPVIQQFPGLFSYLQQVFSYAVPPVAVVFVGGALWSRAQPTAALLSLIMGHAVGLTLLVLSQLNLWHLHFTLNAAVLTVFSAIVLVLASLGGKVAAPPGTVWNRTMAKMTRPMPWWQDYRWQSLAVIVLCLLGIAAFW